MSSSRSPKKLFMETFSPRHKNKFFCYNFTKIESNRKILTNFFKFIAFESFWVIVWSQKSRKYKKIRLCFFLFLLLFIFFSFFNDITLVQKMKNQRLVAILKFFKRSIKQYITTKQVWIVEENLWRTIKEKWRIMEK